MKQKILIAILISLIPASVLAFTENTSPPTQNNTPIPINTSSGLQVKSGPLVSDSYMQASIFYDRYYSGYYVQPGLTSRLNFVIADNTLTYGNSDVNGESRAALFRDRNDSNFYVDPNGVSILNDVRSSIYYDRNNTGYYMDPNGTSRMNYVVFDNTYTYGTGNYADVYLRNAGRWASDTSSFGGIWTINLDGSCRYANYKTGGCTCPAGYGTYQFNDFDAGANCESGFYKDGWRTNNCGIRAYYCGR